MAIYTARNLSWLFIAIYVYKILDYRKELQQDRDVASLQPARQCSIIALPSLSIIICHIQVLKYKAIQDFIMESRFNIGHQI